MATSARLLTSVPPAQDARFTALAAQSGLSKSKLLALLIDAALARNAVPEPTRATALAAGKGLGPGVPAAHRRDGGEPYIPPAKYTIRLRGEDAAALERRAEQRNMLPSSYAGQVLRAHLREGNRYYFDDRTLAFIDGGNQLRAETENRAVIKDLVAIAKVRQWDHIEVRGSETFRRAVWKEAYAEGMTVTGFAPTPLERQTADREHDRRYTAPDGAATPTPASNLGAAADDHSMPMRRLLGNPAAGVVYGRLIDYGAAPYQFDPKNSPSYYVKLDHGNGQVRAYWGVGLAEALSASHTAVAIGDSVGIRHAGSKPVVVTTRGLDAQGQAVVQEVARQRHDWVVEKASYFQQPGRMERDLSARQNHVGEREPAAARTLPELAASVNAVVGEQQQRDQQRVAAVRSAVRTREELQRNYPELGAAVFSQLAAQQRFADEFVKVGLIREQDRQQVIQAMRERLADQLECGDKIVQVEQKKVMALIHQSVLRAADEVGRTPITGRPDRIAGQVRTPKARVHEDVHVRA